MSAPGHGTCDETFAKVRDVFERSFESGEIGAGVAVLIDSEPAIELWGGWADEERPRPWERDTIVNVYSVTKGMASVCMNRLIEQGLLDLDAPVSKYWPEFAQNGKQDIPMLLLISHQAGLPLRRAATQPRQRLDGGHDRARRGRTGVGARVAAGLPRGHVGLRK